jgi:uroporphyrinogen III methyltransferase/synthase
VPTITLHPSPDPERLARAAREVRSYDWLALTSPNGVARFFEALDAQDLDARALGDVRVAAVGPGTAAALRERGIKADLVPKEFHGEALAEAFLAASQGPRVLLPRALVARDVFPERIRAAGGEVDVVAAYETRAPGEETRGRLRELFRERAIDLVTLTSSSTVTNLLDLLGDEGPALLEGVTLASIGPITTATAEKAGLQVAITAASSTLEGLLEAMKAPTAPG